MRESVFLHSPRRVTACVGNIPTLEQTGVYFHPWLPLLIPPLASTSQVPPTKRTLYFERFTNAEIKHRLMCELPMTAGQYERVRRAKGEGAEVKPGMRLRCREGSY